MKKFCSHFFSSTFAKSQHALTSTMNMWLRALDYLFGNQIRKVKSVSSNLKNAIYLSGLRTFIKISKYCALCGTCIFGLLSCALIAIALYSCMYWLVIPQNSIQNQLMLSKNEKGFYGEARFTDCSSIHIRQSLCEQIQNEQYNIILGLSLDKEKVNNFPVRMEIQFKDKSTFISEDIINLNNYTSIWFYVEMIFSFWLPSWIYKFKTTQYVQIPLAYNINNLNGEIQKITIEIKEVNQLLQVSYLRLESVLEGFRYLMRDWFLSTAAVCFLIFFTFLILGYTVVAIIVWNKSAKLLVRIVEDAQYLSEDFKHILKQQIGDTKYD